MQSDIEIARQNWTRQAAKMSKPRLKAALLDSVRWNGTNPTNEIAALAQSVLMAELLKRGVKILEAA